MYSQEINDWAEIEENRITGPHYLDETQMIQGTFNSYRTMLYPVGWCQMKIYSTSRMARMAHCRNTQLMLEGILIKSNQQVDNYVWINKEGAD